MYRCEDCKLIVEDYNDLAEDFGGGRICPYCSGDVEEIEECDCGKYMLKGEKLCEKCKMETRKMFQEFMDELTEEQREYLNEIYDGEEF